MKPDFLKGLKLDGLGISSALRRDLSRVEERMGESLRSELSFIQDLGAAVLETQGKLFRPALVILGGGRPGKSGDSTILAGAVVEMVHTATLLHDDVVDGSRRRRGRATLNARYGDGSAILMADFIYSRAITLLVEAELTQVLGLLAWTVHKMSIGELLQLDLRDRGVIEPETYYRIIYEKTARLIEACCRTGAILGERPPAEIEALGEFGRNIGLAFQVIDDILDYRADPDTLGKPVGADLMEGKQTLPLLKAYERAEPAGRRRIEELLRAGEDVPILLEMVREGDGLELALAEARRLGENARRALEGLPDGSIRQALEATVDIVLERDF